MALRYKKCGHLESRFCICSQPSKVKKQQSTPPTSELEAALKEAKAALNGDSNDAEHDALYRLAECFEKLQAVTTPTKTVSYDVHVVGKLWSGAQAAYTYPAATWRGEDAKQIVNALRRLAGDFTEINDYEVVKHVSWHERIEGGYRSVREDTVVHPWNNQESEDLWQGLSD